jgi:dipeptidyl-peptidase 4
MVALALTGALLHSQEADRIGALNAQLDRIFTAREYDAPRFGPAAWLPDGRGYTTVEPAATRRGSDIVRYDAASGARTILVPTSKLVPPGAQAPLEIDEYSWSADDRRLLVFTNTKRVWRVNTRGDYWVLDIGSGALKRIGGQAADASLMFAKFSPDGSRVAYVRDHNIYVERIDDGQTRQLTSDGSETTINGTSDWVYEEELDLRDGFRWSPDGQRIAYWQFDSTGVGVFSLINDTASLYPSITRIPYPKAGTTNSAARIGIVSAGVPGARTPTTWMRIPGDPRDNYLARLEWIDDRRVGIEQLNRLQNRNDFLVGDAASGEVTRAFRDESKTWVDVVDEVVWLDGKGRTADAQTKPGPNPTKPGGGLVPAKSEFLWTSERDGWRHVYRVSQAGGEARLVTKLDADVIDLVGVDSAAGWLYFLASPSNPTERYLYRSKLDGSNAPERVTPADQPGSHVYDLAPGGRFAFHTWSRLDRVPEMDLVELPAHRSLRQLTDPSALKAKVAPLLKPPAEFFKVDIGGGVALDGWMLKPSSFDAARKYPVIVFVYGEPAGQMATDRWASSNNLFHRALAEAGYVVVCVDNRGTPAPRGAAWRKVVYGTVGDLSSKEQAAAIRALAARHPFIDADRIGIWGWSGGGSNTLNCMFRFPEVYKVGVSVAPVPDQRLYDTIYQERYMGLPQQNAEGYRLGSPINFAEGLKGKLLIMHGSGDDNVHYQGTERLVNRLVELGKPFDLMVYPNRTHSISEGAGTTAHIYKLIARYFVEHLPAGPR